MTRTPLKTKGICAFEFVDSKCRSSGKAISFLFPALQPERSAPLAGLPCCRRLIASKASSQYYAGPKPENPRCRVSVVGAASVSVLRADRVNGVRNPCLISVKQGGVAASFRSRCEVRFQFSLRGSAAAHWHFNQEKRSP